MNLHSTARGYLQTLLWLRTGNFAKPGGQYARTPDHRDPIAGTPFHKHVPARLEPLAASRTGSH